MVGDSVQNQNMWYSQNDSVSVYPAGGEHIQTKSGHYYHYYDNIPFGTKENGSTTGVGALNVSGVILIR